MCKNWNGLFDTDAVLSHSLWSDPALNTVEGVNSVEGADLLLPRYSVPIFPRYFQ